MHIFTKIFTFFAIREHAFCGKKYRSRDDPVPVLQRRLGLQWFSFSVLTTGRAAARRGPPSQFPVSPVPWIVTSMTSYAVGSAFPCTGGGAGDFCASRTGLGRCTARSPRRLPFRLCSGGSDERRSTRIPPGTG